MKNSLTKIENTLQKIKCTAEEVENKKAENTQMKQ